MNKMLTHLNGYKREAVLAPLFKMLEATFDLFVPLVMADIVNVGIAAHDLHYILVRCGILLLLAVIGLTCSLTAQYFSAKAAVGYSTSLRHALFEHIQKLGFTEMDTLGTTACSTTGQPVPAGLYWGAAFFFRLPTGRNRRALFSYAICITLLFPSVIIIYYSRISQVSQWGRRTAFFRKTIAFRPRLYYNMRWESFPRFTFQKRSLSP